MQDGILETRAHAGGYTTLGLNGAKVFVLRRLRRGVGGAGVDESYTCVTVCTIGTYFSVNLPMGNSGK